MDLGHSSTEVVALYAISSVPAYFERWSGGGLFMTTKHVRVRWRRRNGLSRCIYDSFAWIAKRTVLLKQCKVIHSFTRSTSDLTADIYISHQNIKCNSALSGKHGSLCYIRTNSKGWRRRPQWLSFCRKFDVPGTAPITIDLVRTASNSLTGARQPISLTRSSSDRCGLTSRNFSSSSYA